MGKCQQGCAMFRYILALQFYALILTRASHSYYTLSRSGPTGLAGWLGCLHIIFPWDNWGVSGILFWPRIFDTFSDLFCHFFFFSPYAGCCIIFCIVGYTYEAAADIYAPDARYRLTTPNIFGSGSKKQPPCTALLCIRISYYRKISLMLWAALHSLSGVIIIISVLPFRILKRFFLFCFSLGISKLVLRTSKNSKQKKNKTNFIWLMWKNQVK